jgi:hypothetical protein
MNIHEKIIEWSWSAVVVTFCTLVVALMLSLATCGVQRVRAERDGIACQAKGMSYGRPSFSTSVTCIPKEARNTP